MIELKPCPFCGGTSIEVEDFYVRCNDCKMRPGPAEAVIAAWNQHRAGGQGMSIWPTNADRARTEGARETSEFFEGIVQRQRDRIRNLEGEVEKLRGEVREWLCSKCNYVYPQAPSTNLADLFCRRCKGSIAPRRTVELTAAEAKLRAISQTQRYTDFIDAGELEPDPDGEWVRYADVLGIIRGAKE